MSNRQLTYVSATCVLVLLFSADAALAQSLFGSINGTLDNEGSGAKGTVVRIGAICFLLTGAAYLMGKGSIARIATVGIGSLVIGFGYEYIRQQAGG